MNTATISGNDFLDILFNGRNKDYGAYDLRRKYDQRVRNAIMGTASVALVIIGGYALSNVISDKDIRKPYTAVITPLPPLEDLRIDKPIPPPPALPSSNPPPVRSTIRVTTLVIDRDENVSPEEEPPRMTDVATKAVGLTNTIGDDGGIDPSLIPDAGTGVVQVPVGKQQEDREQVFYTVEIPPAFPGGEEALKRYLARNVRYPHIAAENGISGIVVVQFVVDYEGNVGNVKVVSPTKGGGLEEEASRVIKSMPKWKPGKQNGRFVSVLYSIPVNFRLSDQ